MKRILFYGLSLLSIIYILDGIKQLYALAKKWIEEQNAEAKRAAEDKARLEAEEKATEEAKEKAKLTYIESWIREHGTENQRGRLTEQLLPRREAVDAIAAWAFAQFDQPGTFQHVTYPNPDCHSGEDPDFSDDYNRCEEYRCETKHKIDACAELCERQYARLLDIRSALKDYAHPATVELVTLVAYHDCNHDDCYSGYGPAAKVTLTVGPFSFVCYYAIC